MQEKFTVMLTIGGKSNSLGRVNEVIAIVLEDKSRLNELYDCLFYEDAWVRMRAADALEKICRIHPEWLTAYIDRFNNEVAVSTQPSIQWHLAQIYRQVDLTAKQKYFAINWLKHLLSSTKVDWIVAANAMDTLTQFAKDGSISKTETVSLLEIQQQHKSKAVVKRANKRINELSLN